jgi:hypothetical protein
MTEIPENCLFNKRITGCGATELAIRNSIDTIIAMPYVSLVKNKSICRRDSTYVLGVYQGITEDDIKRYALTEQKLKIATTYDSIPKVIKVLEDIGRNPFKDAFLLVDEWHCLFNDYLYRRDCIRRLLSFAMRFDRTTYMSATPIAREFLFDEIKHLPINEVEWPNPTPISVRSEQTNNPIEYIVEYCRSI